MKAYSWFVLKRFTQMIVVIYAGVSVAFLISHLSPISPVESVLGRITARSNFSPEAIEAMRSALTDMYGVDKPLPEQYVNFWRRFLQGDLGPSLLAFPTPSMTLVMRALPWTVFLLSTAVLVTWSLGNLFGGLAGYFQNNRLLKVFGVAAMGVQPIPYYIVAFLFLIFFGLRVADPADLGRLRHERRAGVEHGLHPLRHRACDPAGHLADRRRVRDLVPRDEGAGLEHRDRGLCDLCRACWGAAPTRGRLLCDAQRRRAAVDGAGTGARVRSSPARSSPNRSTPIPAWARCWSMRSIKATAPRCSRCRRLPSSQ